MEKSFVIYWGPNKDGSPFFESNISIKDLAEEPCDPKDERVCKYKSEEEALTHLEISYDNPLYGTVLPMETAVAIHSKYLTTLV